MDPATAGGLAVGVASLLFDVFDNCVKCKRTQWHLRHETKFNQVLGFCPSWWICQETASIAD
jgi:hypothetical protein